MTNFDAMGKTELRAACKAAGVAYGKLNNDGMRAALATKMEAINAQLISDGAGPAETSVEQIPVSDSRKEPDDFGIPATVGATEAPVRSGKGLGELVADAAAKPVKSKKVTASKLEKDRPSQNGVTRPSVGTICRQIWDALDAKRATMPKDEVLSFEHVRVMMNEKGWARNTAFTQFQRWKEYNGIMPRVTVAKS